MIPPAYISDTTYIRLDKVIGLQLNHDMVLVRFSDDVESMALSKEEAEGLFAALGKWQVNESPETATATAGWPDKRINWNVEKTEPVEPISDKPPSQVFEELMAKAPASMGGKPALPIPPGVNYGVDDPSLSNF